MKVTKEMKEAHKRLSRLNVDFIDFVERNPEALKASNFKLLDLNDKLFKLQPWPTFINHESKKEIQQASVALFDLIKSIPRRIFDNDPYKISKYLEIPHIRAKHQLEGVNDRHLEDLLARGDFIVSPSSGLKCIEYNVTACLGGWNLPSWELLYLNNPVISGFLKEYRVKINNENLLSLMLEHLIHSSPDPDTPPHPGSQMNIAVVVPGFIEGTPNTTKFYLNHLYQEILKDKCKDNTLKGSVFMCDYAHITPVDGYAFYKDKRIHLIIEMYNGNVPPQIMELFKSGRLRLVNGPITDLLSNKLLLALLSDDETSGAFTVEEREVIDAYIPWTRKIAAGVTGYGGERVQLEEFILSNRENLVIKPSDAMGGDNVYIGRKTPGKKWEQVLKTGLQHKNWLVQEYVEPSQGLYQTGEEDCVLHDTVWGFFVFGSRYGGGWGRVLPAADNQGAINCHQGATVSVVFEVDE
ncbi:MAG: hypothetical protein JSV88_27330 [Candidatus Aminicenantes bacterium]|nr:MAG: hypothetical protein JSV88_27330 [Candidatus Aminicenantes bacterium]